MANARISNMTIPLIVMILTQNLKYYILSNVVITYVMQYIYVMLLNPLSKEEEKVVVHKGTEPPFSGKYDAFFNEGTYVCRRCNTPLYTSNSKFHSSCGWPSFDQEIKGAVTHIPDFDGIRTEIQCSACKAHLGHVFFKEHFTKKNIRHCVNSLSLQFVPKK